MNAPAARPALLSLALALGVVVTGGSCASEGASCRASEDCAGSLECAGPSDPQVCGIPANEQCSADDDCGPELRCHAVDDPCSPDGVGSECRSPCTPGSCSEGFQCGDSAACEVLPCDETDVCPSYQLCDPSLAGMGPVHTRTGGCVSIPCESDAPCPADAACANGMCQAGAGSCVEPQAVP